MNKIITTLVITFLSTVLAAQPKNVQGKVTSKDSADLSILNIYPATFPDVSVVFRAETRKGEPVWNLSKEKMRVTENGSSCDVISLEHLSANKPIVLGIVFDHSGSMGAGISSEGTTVVTQINSPIDSAKKAVKNFVKSFNASKDLIGVIGFSDKVDVNLPATQDINKINSVIDSMQPTLSTALYDAMITGIDGIKAVDGLKVLVVLTDGYDNFSKAKWKDVAEKAIKENIPVYIVGLGYVNKDTLNLIAARAKGKCFFTESSSSLNTIYAEISKQIRAFYDLTYRSKNFSSADTTRTVELRFDIDSLYLVTEPSKASIPEEVIEAVAKKQQSSDFYLYGGIAVVALVVTGFLVYRFFKSTEEKKSDMVPVIKKVFPNPSSGPLTIQIEGKASQLKVFNMNGQLLGAFAVIGGETHLNFSSSPRGTYIIIAYYGVTQSNAVQFMLE